MSRVVGLLVLAALGSACQKSTRTTPIDDRTRLERDVGAVAKPRPPNSAGWRETRARLSQRLAELGYRVERHDYGSGSNVIGARPGTGLATEQVLVSAHYDHIPGCAGADDNASGVAAVLEVARRLSSGQYARTLLVAFWDEEERGLLGSRAYAARARARGEDLRAAFVLDAVGYQSAEPGSQRVPAGFDQAFPDAAAALGARRHAGDFLAILADPAAAEANAALGRHAARIGLPVVGLSVSAAQALALPDTLRSDHASFWAAGFPALLLTDTGDLRNPSYHCQRAPDVASSVDFVF